MEALSLLHSVADSLQQDANASRIKKLLNFTCHGIWEANPSRVAQLDLQQLLEELHRQAPTAEQLQEKLSDSIKRINKKAEYAQVAKLVSAWMLQIYNGDLENAAQDFGFEKAGPDFSPEPRPWADVQKVDYSPFDLRLDVIRQTNPLRAKMVLYTALFHPLEGNDSGLAVLKQHSLDELLELFFSRCTTPEEVENGMRAAAQSLPDPSQGSQAAGALIQAMRSLFVYVQPPQYEPQMPGGLGEVEEQETPEVLEWMDGHAEQGQIDPPAAPSQATVKVYPAPPTVDDRDLAPEPDPVPAQAAPPVQDQRQPISYTPNMEIKLDAAIQALLDKRGADLMVTIENTLSELGNQLDERLQDEDPQDYLTLKHQVLRGFLKDVESSSSTFIPILRKWEESERRLVHPNLDIPPMEDGPQARDPYTSLRRVLVDSPLVRDKSELDQEVMRLVKRSIITVKNDIDTALRNLGNELEDNVQNRSLTEGLTLKYQALRAFVHDVERISSKFSALLTKMEDAERRLFGI